MKFDAPVLLVGAGPVSPALLQAAGGYEYVVAVDGGLNAIERLGLVPDAVIGDMDSVLPAHLEKYRTISHTLSEQETTDFQKALSRITAPLVLGIGFLGGRLDHELAGLSVLAKMPCNVILVGEVDLVFRVPETLELSLPPATRISFFPMGEISGVTSEGLEWPLDGLTLAPDKTVSISNRTCAAQMSVSCPDQPLLCILPREYLPATLKRFKF